MHGRVTRRQRLLDLEAESEFAKGLLAEQVRTRRYAVLVSALDHTIVYRPVLRGTAPAGQVMTIEQLNHGLGRG